MDQPTTVSGGETLGFGEALARDRPVPDPQDFEDTALAMVLEELHDSTCEQADDLFSHWDSLL